MIERPDTSSSAVHVLGKPVGNDLRQKILTLPALIYLEDHPGDPDLNAIIHRQTLDEQALKGLVGRICRSAAIERALETAGNFVREALEDLAGLPDCPERFALAEIALNIVERDT